MVEPIPDDDAGIGIAAVENDLFCLINSYLDMKEDDVLEVYLGAKQVKELRVKPEEVNKRLYFYISKTEVTSGRMELYYLLTRAGETVPDDPSVKLLLFIKLYKPAKDARRHTTSVVGELAPVGWRSRPKWDNAVFQVGRVSRFYDGYADEREQAPSPQRACDAPRCPSKAERRASQAAFPRGAWGRSHPAIVPVHLIRYPPSTSDHLTLR